jgi:hypothetical protein
MRLLLPRHAEPGINYSRRHANVGISVLAPALCPEPRGGRTLTRAYHVYVTCPRRAVLYPQCNRECADTDYTRSEAGPSALLLLNYPFPLAALNIPTSRLTSTHTPSTAIPGNPISALTGSPHRRYVTEWLWCKSRTDSSLSPQFMLFTRRYEHRRQRFAVQLRPPPSYELPLFPCYTPQHTQTPLRANVPLFYSASIRFHSLRAANRRASFHSNASNVAIDSSKDVT